MNASNAHPDGSGTKLTFPKPIAICIRPKHRTVGALLIKESVIGFGLDVLIVCGFAFGKV